MAGNLDLNIADDEEFSPDKLRSTIERLYMTIGVGVLSFAKHIARLRSWGEARRTTAFCAAYFIAWVLDYLMPLFSLTLITLIVYPPSRDVLFPPAPLALVSAKSGGVQKPKAGVLGSTDSATGAPENYKGEAVEAEASNFVSGLTSITLASASGKHPQDDPEHNSEAIDDPIGGRIPDPTAVAKSASNARAAATTPGGNSSPEQDKTKVPMENAMWSKMRPLMHGIGEACDTWERFGNALEPTPPFPRDVYRIRLAGLVVPLLAAAVFVTSYMFVKGMTFGIGFGFFGDPLIQRGVHWLNATFPNWQKLLEVRNTILKGVPTNAQLTLTMLRIGEANSAPLPPPPVSGDTPTNEPVQPKGDGSHGENLNATDEELRTAIEHDPNTPHQSAGADVDAAKQKSHGKKAHRLLHAAKAGLKGTIESAMGADHLKAKVGSKHAKQRLGVIPSSRESHLSGPVEFKCRYNGKRGNAYISSRATIPCISFALGDLEKSEDELRPIWSVAIADISALKKFGGLGWKAKLVVSWALEREVADGIEIVDKQGNSCRLTAMVLRDELFNRLVAMGGQKWEAL